MFFHGEDAVADDLAPFIDAAPREEQKYFLATQQVDEARHAIFFKRFMHEVVGRRRRHGRRRAARRRAASSPGASAKTFALLDEITGALRTRPLARGARAGGDDVPRRRRGAARPARPALHLRLPRAPRPAARASARACSYVALDEQRHIGFGVKLLHDLRARGPARSATRSPTCCARSRPYSLAVFVPPGWDRSYTECFGFTLEEIYTEGARSFEAKLRSAGLPLESLPGPSVFPLTCAPPSARERGLAMLRAGFIGPGNGAPPRDPAAMALLFDSVAPRGRPPHRARRARSRVQWEFADAEPWHLRVDNGSTAAAARPGRARRPRAALPPTATGSTSSPAGWTRAARWPPAGCARAARRARSGPPARCSETARRVAVQGGPLWVPETLGSLRQAFWMKVK